MIDNEFISRTQPRDTVIRPDLSLFEERPASRTEPRITKPSRRRGFIEDLSPEFGLQAAAWVRSQRDPGWRVVAIFLSIVLVSLGSVALFGGGYATIQGIRIPLNKMGLPVITAGFPALVWWTFPLVLTLIQIFAKRVPGLRWLWRPSIFFDALTSAVFLSGLLTTLLFSYNRPLSTGALAAICATLGLGLACVAERLFLAGLCMVKAAISR